ncbi:MAG: hypothetical protein M0P71_16580 [Melioribacteraceae bacterium]|jgi:hypothetical protein|nr:hypothetical protein [Melioribacteraceae bacterium]
MKIKLILLILAIGFSIVSGQNIIPHRGIIQEVYGGDTTEFRMQGNALNITGSQTELQIGGDPLVSESTQPIKYATINITSANILAGDSVLIKSGETDITPLLFKLKYNFNTIAYTTFATDTTYLYCYALGVKHSFAFLYDSTIMASDTNVTTYGSGIDQFDEGTDFWIDFKNFDTGNGTVTIEFYYIKFE